MQVSPSSFRVRSCKPLDGNQIKITPTIPVNKDPNSDQLSITFGLPKDRSLQVTQGTKDVCRFTLEGTKEITVDIKPDCKALGKDTSKTRLIVIEFEGGGLFWFAKRNKHTVWVSSCFYALVIGIQTGTSVHADEYFYSVTNVFFKKISSGATLKSLNLVF